LRYFYLKSQTAVFECADFVSTMQKGEDGDVFYCDPPYIALSATSKFTSYSTENFTESDQRKLAEEAQRLFSKNISVVISNHATDFTKELYKHARLETFEVRRTISCKTTARNKVPELLAIYTHDFAQKRDFSV
jgi:DNA adenine methylase